MAKELFFLSNSFQLFFNLSIVSLIEPTILPSLKMIVFNRLNCNDLASVSWEYCLKHSYHKFLDLSLTILLDSILKEISTFCFVFSQESNNNCSQLFRFEEMFFSFLSFFHSWSIKNREVKSIDKITSLT